MIPDKIIYTDGHTVTVTDSMFQVKNHEYRLNGITKHGLLVMKPQRLPGVLMVVVGVALMILGIARLVPANTMDDVRIGDMVVNVNTMSLFVGALFAFIGVLIVGLVREKYAVRIATAEGEKNVIVSHHKEYISQIVDALSSSFHYLRGNTPGNFWRQKSR